MVKSPRLSDNGAPALGSGRPGDAVPSGWVEEMPPGLQPYLRLMRLDRPIGIWLLYWPCVFGLILGAAAEGRMLPRLPFLLLMGIGAIVMRGAGCTFNDIVDRDFDAKVARTRDRPIPSGAVSVKQAVLFALGLSLLGLLILLAFNRITILIGASSLLLVVVYPFMKRITWWPQAWLGLTFNWGALVGYAAESAQLDPAALLLYAGCFFWTLGYDTIYAHQDKEDDALIGVKSSALRLGRQTRPFLYIFYVLACLFIMAAGLLAGLGTAFAIGLCGAGAHLVWQVRTLDIDRPLRCLRLFRANRDTGALIAAAMLVGAVAGF
jgi:4-hydroxybenzoate polyprenyltransferase